MQTGQLELDSLTLDLIFSILKVMCEYGCSQTSALNMESASSNRRTSCVFFNVTPEQRDKVQFLNFQIIISFLDFFGFTGLMSYFRRSILTRSGTSKMWRSKIKLSKSMSVMGYFFPTKFTWSPIFLFWISHVVFFLLMVNITLLFYKI